MESELVNLLQSFSFQFQAIYKDCAWAKTYGDLVWGRRKAGNMAIECFFVVYFELNFSSFDICEANHLIASWHEVIPHDLVICVVDLAHNNAALIAYETSVDILLDVFKISLDHI